MYDSFWVRGAQISMKKSDLHFAQVTRIGHFSNRFLGDLSLVAELNA
jgi:hypothetical protein